MVMVVSNAGWSVVLVCVEANPVGVSVFLAVVVVFAYVFDSGYGVCLCCSFGFLGLAIVC